MLLKSVIFVFILVYFYIQIFSKCKHKLIFLQIAIFLTKICFFLTKKRKIVTNEFNSFSQIGQVASKWMKASGHFPNFKGWGIKVLKINNL